MGDFDGFILRRKLYPERPQVKQTARELDGTANLLSQWVRDHFRVMPTGQWSEPWTSGRITASATLPMNEVDTPK